MGEQRRLDLRQRLVDHAAAPCLKIALDLARVPAGGAPAIDEQRRVGERRLEARQGWRIEQIGDTDQVRGARFARQPVRPAWRRIDPGRALI